MRFQGHTSLFSGVSVLSVSLAHPRSHAHTLTHLRTAHMPQALSFLTGWPELRRTPVLLGLGSKLA